MRTMVAVVAALVAAGTIAGPLPLPPGSRSRLATPPPVTAWDCWIDAQEGGGIRCIADRDPPPALPEDYTDDDEAAEVLLELVHDYLHRGKPARSSELVREEAHLLRREDLWTISLSGPPLESSWNEARPEQLARSLLCRRVPGCTVSFHR